MKIARPAVVAAILCAFAQPAIAADAAMAPAVSTMLVGLFWGMIIVPAVYDIVFYAVMRERFMIWHGIRALAIIVYALGTINPELVMMSDASPELLWWFNMLGFGMMVALAGPFLREYLEPGTISPRVHRLLGWSMPYIMAITLIGTVTNLPQWLFVAKEMAYVPFIFLIGHALFTAARQGSRAALFQIVAWVPPGIICTYILWGNLFNQPLLPFKNTALLITIAFEFGIVGVGIANRVIALQRQRDDALAEARASARLAHTDLLTGLPNRRAMLRHYTDNADPQNPVTALALLDLDRFKRINDRHGHDVGDLVLVAVGETLAGYEDVFAARMGGEEFAILIYAEHPEKTAESLRLAVAARVANDVPGLSLEATASLGLTRVVRGEPLHEALKRADEHLYIAKRNGRDQSRWPEIPRARLQSAA